MSTRQAAKIDDLIAFNQQLISLSDAGVPIELGDGSPSVSLPQQLELIQSRIGLQVGRGVTLEQAMTDDPMIPAPYRAAWKTWFHGDQPLEALNALSSQAEARREMQVNVGSSLIQPLIVLTLVYIGFLYLTLVASQQLEATYEQIHEPPSASLSALILARQWLPLWGSIIPLAILLAMIYWLRNSANWNYDWLPGRKRFTNAIHKATYADNLARLIETNHSLTESLTLLGPIKTNSTSANTSASVSTISSANPSKSIPTVELPSMLRWAAATELNSSQESSSRGALLRFTARAYRGAANKEVVRWRNWLPVLVGVFLGGGLVLFYGLSLFTPMIELLQMLTKP